MLVENCVSIWIGKSTCSHDLEKYVATRYSADGDYVGSYFSKEFHIDFIDNDFLEQSFTVSSLSLVELLNGFSYAERIILELLNREIMLESQVNSAILLYNYDYGQNTYTIEATSNFQYLGTHLYR